MLEVTDLHFGYSRAAIALQAISLTARRGQITALLGPNGAGKTTLFRCILGALRPTRGRVTVDGIALSTLSTAARARRLAYVPQEWHSPFRFTVLEAVLMGRTAHLGWLSVPRAADVKRAQTLLATLGIAPLADRGMDQISGGERQLALLARALIQEATVLLLDEPTAHLDLHHQVQVFAHLKRQVQRDQLAAFVTLHDPNLAAQFADAVVLLKKGRLMSYGHVQDTLTAPALAALYGTPVEAAMLGGRPIFRGKVASHPEDATDSIARSVHPAHPAPSFAHPLVRPSLPSESPSEPPPELPHLHPSERLHENRSHSMA